MTRGQEARLEAVVWRLREAHKTCPEGIPEFTCNLKYIDEHEVEAIVKAWREAK